MCIDVLPPCNRLLPSRLKPSSKIIVSAAIAGLDTVQQCHVLGTLFCRSDVAGETRAAAHNGGALAGVDTGFGGITIEKRFEARIPILIRSEYKIAIAG
jgi:hypothetical protein